LSGHRYWRCRRRRRSGDRRRRSNPPWRRTPQPKRAALAGAMLVRPTPVAPIRQIASASFRRNPRCACPIIAGRQLAEQRYRPPSGAMPTDDSYPLAQSHHQPINLVRRFTKRLGTKRFDRTTSVRLRQSIGTPASLRAGPLIRRFFRLATQTCKAECNHDRAPPKLNRTAVGAEWTIQPGAPMAPRVQLGGSS
jgi:hypothetical protein